MRIAVVGCGSAGAAVAVFMRRQGHTVELFERAPSCEPVGAGFLLQPSGMAVLEQLGILEPVISYGGRVERLHVMDGSGGDLLELNYRELGDGVFGLGLHRPVLMHFLIEALQEADVPVRWGAEVTAAEKTGDGWTLEFASGEERAGFDLLVAADGARSSLRKTLVSPGRDFGYPWGAHWFIGKNGGAFPTEELFQVVSGTRHLAGFLATGRDLTDDDALVSLFWSIRIADDARIRSEGLEAWKEKVRRLVPRAGPVLDQITGWEQVLTARYGDVRMRRWHGDGFVLLGDCAHAMSPQLGQGVNLALQDAACLSRCLSRNLDLRDALAEYSRRRRWVLRYYQLATRQLTPWFQSDLEWLTPVRWGLFRAMQHFPPTRIAMTRTMAGV